MKKIFLSHLLSCYLGTFPFSVSFAHTGFYAGIGTGFDSLKTKITFSQTVNGTLIQPSPFNINLQGNQVSWGICAGYMGKLVDFCLIGAEGYVDFAKPEDTHQFSSPTGAILPNGNGFVKFSVKRTPLFGFSLRLSFLPHARLNPFIRIGVEYTSLDFSVRNDYQELVTGNGKLIGFAAGLGLDCFLTRHFLLRADWSFSKYRNSLFGQFAIAPNWISRNTKSSSRGQTARLGVGYVF